MLNSPALWVAAGLLWVPDAPINISMEPFRAFVGDQLPSPQRATGYAMQSFFIGTGSVVASLLPWLLAKYGVSNTAAAGSIPDTVRFAFYAGALALFGAIGWTVLSTREYSPDRLAAFDDARPASDAPRATGTSAAAWPWLVTGLAGVAIVFFLHIDKQLYLLAGGIAAYGLVQIAVGLSRPSLASAALGLLPGGASRSHNLFTDIVHDMHTMPATMRQLAVVQFFSWFALFAMWIYTTAAVTQVHFGATDAQSAAYNEGANWVGVLFAAYNDSHGGGAPHPANDAALRPAHALSSTCRRMA